MKVVLILMVFFFTYSAYAQHTKSLSIGDTIPDFTFKNIINTDTVFRTKELKKPLLLDFFGTYCSGCIAALPYLNNLQEELKDSLQILVVSREPLSTLSKFLQTNKLVEGIRLPFIVSDTVLHNLFPHLSIPHQVWISKDGIVRAITTSDFVNKENLQKLIAGDHLQLPLKNDYQQYNSSIPLSENASARESNFLFTSVVAGFINNARPSMTGASLSENKRYKRYYFINMNPLNFFSAALNYRFTWNRFILSVHDSSKLVNVYNQHDWFLHHAISYEVTVPQNMSRKDVERHILNDVVNIIGVQVSIEKREMPCYVLVKDQSNSIKDPASKGGESASAFFNEIGKSVYIRNGSLEGLMKAMNSGSLKAGVPITIDESGYDNSVDIDLGPIDIKDISAVNKGLKPYGFKLTPTTRLLEMVEIKDLLIQNN